MNVEENRLRTFSNWPGNAAVDYNRIARAGFYYTGRSTEVQCFLCGGRISEWNYGDQAMVRHRQIDPNCPFVVNPSATCNVPLVSSNNSTPVSSSSTTSPSRQQTNVPSQLPAPSVSTINSQTPRSEYRTEAQRLRSFVNWPISMIVTPESLAKAGFYYLQESDMVRIMKFINYRRSCPVDDQCERLKIWLRANFTQSRVVNRDLVDELRLRQFLKPSSPRLCIQRFSNLVWSRKWGEEGFDNCLRRNFSTINYLVLDILRLFIDEKLDLEFFRHVWRFLSCFCWRNWELLGCKNSKMNSTRILENLDVFLVEKTFRNGRKIAIFKNTYSHIRCEKIFS